MRARGKKGLSQGDPDSKSEPKEADRVEGKRKKTPKPLAKLFEEGERKDKKKSRKSATIVNAEAIISVSTRLPIAFAKQPAFSHQQIIENHAIADYYNSWKTWSIYVK